MKNVLITLAAILTMACTPVGQLQARRFTPFLEPLESPEFTTGAPYLIQTESVMWNSLTPLGGDDILACCMYNGKVTLVRGTVRLKDR